MYISVFEYIEDYTKVIMSKNYPSKRIQIFQVRLQISDNVLCQN